MVEVLKSQAQIDSARATLDELGADTTHGWRRRLFQTAFLMRFRRPAEPVAVNKSWDVLKMLQSVEKYFPNKDASIFDMGSYNCEIPVSLWMRGYRNIRAADLNPLGRCIRWYGAGINFQEENFYKPEVQEESFDVMTSVSVIEHGYDQDNFLSVCQKYLKPGGMVLFSTDYHEQKLEIPEDFRIFHLPYMIFSKEEIEDLIEQSAKYDLEPVGDINLGSSEYPIHFVEKDFTFIYLAFRKKK